MILEILLGVFAVIFQFIAAYCGYKIYKFNRESKWWIALIVAFIIQGIRRIFTIFEDLDIIKQNLLLDRSLMFLTSLLIVIGLWTMMKNFESFKILQHKIKKKLD
jgi:hypothetical protein